MVDFDEKFEGWKAGYIPRARLVEIALTQLFQDAMNEEEEGAIFKNQGVTTSLEYLRRERGKLSYRIAVFAYSSQFDAEFEKQVLDPSEAASALAAAGIDVGPEEIFARKAERLNDAFKALVMCADCLANCYVAALMSDDRNPGLPLIWQVPVLDETETGFSAEAIWWVTLQYLCELSSVIFLYSGVSNYSFREMEYLRKHPHLWKRVLWLQQDLVMWSPNYTDKDWQIQEIKAAIASVQD